MSAFGPPPRNGQRKLEAKAGSAVNSSMLPAALVSCGGGTWTSLTTTLSICSQRAQAAAPDRMARRDYTEGSKSVVAGRQGAMRLTSGTRRDGRPWAQA